MTSPAALLLALGVAWHGVQPGMAWSQLRFSKEGAPYAASVRLKRDENSSSGYRWAVGKGPAVRLTSGTLAKAEITTRERRPLELVVPMLKRLTGIAG